jgi:glycolate oxidase
VVGSEGTLALVTEITLRLSPTMAHSATILVPFSSLNDVTRIVPSIVASGLEPSILEYADAPTMIGMTQAASFELGINAEVATKTAAYLLIVLETRTAEQLEGDLGELAALVESGGALDLFVLPDHAAPRLIKARENLFWVSKAAGANEIIDVVVPRSTVPVFLEEAQRMAERHGALIFGCGHVGDGNVHLSIFQDDEERRAKLVYELFAFGLGLGGQISGEHGIGLDKQGPYLALTDPILLELQRKIKTVFDPEQLLNPYRLLDDRPLP